MVLKSSHEWANLLPELNANSDVSQRISAPTDLSVTVKCHFISHQRKSLWFPRSQLNSKCQGFEKAIITQANTPLGSKLVYDGDKRRILQVTPEIFRTFAKVCCWSKICLWLLKYLTLGSIHSVCIFCHKLCILTCSHFDTHYFRTQYIFGIFYLTNVDQRLPELQFFCIAMLDVLFTVSPGQITKHFTLNKI